jgi:riboflavin biosynthesis pyrimidine reductase
MSHPFFDRKTRIAAAATLPPYVTLEDHHDRSLQPIGNDWSRRLFDGDFYLSPSTDPRRPSCSLVFVQSRDGNTGAPNPSALGGGETDAHLVYEGLSRVAADAVLAGAGTIGSGDHLFSVWHPELVRLRESLGKPRHPAQIIATLQGINVEHGVLFNTLEVPVILLTLESCARGMRDAVAARPWMSIVTMENPTDLPKAFEQLHALGIERVSAVGGRKIATRLIDAGLVQDLYLTTSPRPGGEPDTPLYPRRLPARLILRKQGTGPEAGVIFEHRRISGLPDELDLEQLRP